ncbi:MAG: hypothetical protein ACNS62_08945 [Candidatus Cyclobacteriaceae bacterium M3_2C_046]
MLEINNQNKHQIIEKYFKNELDAASQQVFQEKYENDPDFKEEVDRYELITYTFQNLSDDAAQRIEKILQNQQAQPEEQSARVVPLWRKKSFLAVAASVALVMVAGIVFWVSDDQPAAYTAEAEIMNSFSLGIKPGDNLGFSEQPDRVTDSVQILIVKHDQWDRHYQYLNDTIRLFLNQNISPEAISLEQREQDYLLKIQDENYLIDRGFETIKPLKKE